MDFFYLEQVYHEPHTSTCSRYVINKLVPESNLSHFCNHFHANEITVKKRFAFYKAIY